jgi:hypothetical protein
MAKPLGKDKYKYKGGWGSCLPYRRVDRRFVVFAGDYLVGWVGGAFYLRRDGEWSGPLRDLLECEAYAAG